MNTLIANPRNTFLKWLQQANQDEPENVLTWKDKTFKNNFRHAEKNKCYEIKTNSSTDLMIGEKR